MKFFITLLSLVALAAAAPAAEPVAKTEVEARAYAASGGCGWTGFKRDADGAAVAC